MQPVKLATSMITLLAFLFSLSGCRFSMAAEPASIPAATSSSTAWPSPSSTAISAVENRDIAASTPACFFSELAAGCISEMGTPAAENTPFETIRMAYRYVIGNTHFIPYEHPLLVNSWQYLDNCGTAPTIYQVYAMGPLYYHIGTCEHYSAALIILLEQLGFQALYVPGLTYSYEGKLVEHAWVMVQVNGEWFHLDPQLDDNVIRGSQLTYRYFLKNDADFSQHHVWGRRLPEPDFYALSLPDAYGVAPVFQPEPIEKSPLPDIEQLKTSAQQLALSQPPGNQQAPTGFIPAPPTLA